MSTPGANGEAWRDCIVAQAVLASKGDRVAQADLGEKYKYYADDDRVLTCERCLRELPLIEVEPTLDGLHGTVALGSIRRVVTSVQCDIYEPQEVPQSH